VKDGHLNPDVGRDILDVYIIDQHFEGSNLGV